MTSQTTREHLPTTTHAAWGAGHPRLFISRADDRFEHLLTEDLVRIGSSPDNEITLTEADAIHATITHNDQDEYVLTLLGKGEMNANPDADNLGNRTELLRTGARFTVGPWTFVFFREEYADHGRPYGGRQGGEGSDQPAQPPRPNYSEHVREEDSGDNL